MGTGRRWGRRSVVSGLGAAAGLVVVPGAAHAQPAVSAFQPPRHPQDEWLDKIPGKHRVFVDATTAAGAAEALAFAGNLFEGNRAGYDLADGDLAIVLCLRHMATVFAFTDAIWSQHGKALADAVRHTNPRSAEPPTGNPHTAAPRNALGALAKRGVQFAVCDMATARFARMLAGSDGEVEAMHKRLLSNAIPNSRFVPAGVVALTRAQEYGYSLLYAG
ncbi:MAG: hypothetical protein ACT4QD_21005 [Acidobacteriota bacterium]